MKKGTAILLCTSMMLVAAGCADNASSSVTSEAESVNSSQESSSDINSVISSEESSITTSAVSSEESSESKPVTASEDGFKVDGTKLIDANGNEFVMRGVNHAHTWFKSDSVVAIPSIAATGSNTVRLVFSDGDQWEKDDLDSIKSLIESCKEIGRAHV